MATRLVAQRYPGPLARPLLCRPGDTRAQVACGTTTRPGSLVALGGDRVRYYLVDLPPTASLRALVRLAHQRRAIKQQYQELKDEIGLDHFEGRTLLGWQRPMVLTAIAYSFLQNNVDAVVRRI